MESILLAHWAGFASGVGPDDRVAWFLKETATTMPSLKVRLVALQGDLTCANRTAVI